MLKPFILFLLLFLLPTYAYADAGSPKAAPQAIKESCLNYTHGNNATEGWCACVAEKIDRSASVTAWMKTKLVKEFSVTSPPQDAKELGDIFLSCYPFPVKVDNPPVEEYSSKNPAMAIPEALEDSCYGHKSNNGSDGFCQCAAMAIYDSTAITAQTKFELIKNFSTSIKSSAEAEAFKTICSTCRMKTINFVATPLPKKVEGK